MKFIRLLNAEFIKIIGDIKSYWFNYIFGNLNVFFMFLGILYAFAVNDGSAQSVFTLLFGLMIWYYGVHAIDLIAIIVEEEIGEGTLSQIYMSRTSFVYVLFNRIVSQIIFDTIKGIFVFMLCLLAFRIPVAFLTQLDWLTIVVIFIIILLGLYGLGYMIAGLSLIYKNTTTIAGSCSNLLLFFTGITIQYENLPVFARIISRVFPTYYGMELLSKSIADSAGFFQIFLSKGFGMLFICSAIWIVLGVLVFKGCENRMKEKGSISQY